MWRRTSPKAFIVSELALRAFSTQQKTQQTLKQKLRAVYRLIHPDLFHGLPTAQEANERSLKLLQEYVAAASKHGSISVAVPYRFEFYLKNSEATPGPAAAAAGAVAAAAAEASQPGSQGDAAPAATAAQEHHAGDSQQTEEAGQPALRHVTLTLPPPSRSGSSSDGLAPASKRALGRLFAALGLRDAGLFADDDTTHGRTKSLREGLPPLAEALQQAAAQAHVREHAVHTKAAMRLRRGVTLSWAAGPASPAAELAAVEQLARVLGQLSELDLQGLRLVLGEEYGVDPVGAVWLEAGGSEAAWLRYLSEVDLQQCRERRELVARVKAQEASVAQALGLGMLFTDRQAALSPAYLQFLQQAAAAGAEVGPIGGGRFSDVAVCVLQQPATPTSSSTDPAVAAQGTAGAAAAGPGSLSEDYGIITVPVCLTAKQLAAEVERLGANAQAVRQRHRQVGEQRAALRRRVEQRLQLRRLLLDPQLEDHKARAAMLRLLDRADSDLRQLLGGLALQIADVGGISLAPDSSYIRIPWDWTL